VFTNPTSLYTDRIKHVIGPEVTFLYRRVDTPLLQNEFAPGTDPQDRLPDTTELRYGIVQSFLGKRPGPAGRLIPHEFLNWRVFQTYYALPEASNFDQQYYSALFGIEQEEARTLSPIQSTLRFRPTNRVSATLTTEYDVEFRQMRRLNLSGGLGFDRFTLNGGWTRDEHPERDPNRRQVTINTVQGGGRLDLVPGRLRIEGNGTYDFKTSKFVNRTTVLRYDIQCCGFSIQHLAVDYRSFKKSSFAFQIQLANIGAVGNFGDADQLGGGYRRR
jgi:hypothetical protein